MTKDLGLQLIDTERESNILGSVSRALKENRVVFIECDEIEKWKQSQNEKMLFLGKTIGVDKTINLIQRRTGAEVVFGVLHRFSLRKYRLIIESYEDMLSKLGKRHSSVGKLVLKTFEQYVYAGCYDAIETIRGVIEKLSNHCWAPTIWKLCMLT